MISPDAYANHAARWACRYAGVLASGMDGDSSLSSGAAELQAARMTVAAELQAAIMMFGKMDCETIFNPHPHCNQLFQDSALCMYVEELAEYVLQMLAEPFNY